MPFYQVNNKQFTNKFQAACYAKKHGQELKFDFYDKEFSNANWDQEPSLSWDQLLDIRAQQIAAKNKPILLNFSGGTDSYTMLAVFRRNDIKIDYIHLNIKLDEGEKVVHEGAENFLKTHSEEFKNSKIIISKTDVDMLNTYYNSPNWVWENDIRIHFAIALVDAMRVEDNAYFANSIDQDYISLSGYEKPRLYIENGNFYSYLEDTTFQGSMGNPRNERFFTAGELPELHIKQCYMLAKYIKMHAKENNRLLDSYNLIHDPNFHDYYEYAYKGCGRFGDLTRSDIQKVRTKSTRLYIPDGDIQKTQHIGRYHNMLSEGLTTGQPFAKNYLEGMLALRNDPLLSELFRDKGNYYSLKDIQSKYYKLNI